jgi:hypothetical protein
MKPSLRSTGDDERPIHRVGSQSSRLRAFAHRRAEMSKVPLSKGRVGPSSSACRASSCGNLGRLISRLRADTSAHVIFSSQRLQRWRTSAAPLVCRPRSRVQRDFSTMKRGRCLVSE